MSTNILQHPEAPVKKARFVPAHIEPTEADEYAAGRRMYTSRRPLSDCTTDAMSEGWNAAADADLRGALAYLRAMQREGMNAEFALEVM